MKRLVFLLLVSVCSRAQDFSTGQAARLVVGQRTFTEQEPGARADLVGGVGGVAYANDTLYVTDANRVGSSPENHRVLIFSNLSAQLPGPNDELFFTRPCPVCVGEANTVLGQPDFTTADFGLDRNKLRTPTAIATDGKVLAVADTDNNRVLIWNSIPAVNNQPPDVVLGQANFTSAFLPPGLTPTASSLRGPQGVWIQGNQLFIADTGNNRIVIHNQIPTSNNRAADIVVGQANFTTRPETDITKFKQEVSAATMYSPVSVTTDGVRMYVADLGYNRVLMFNSIPTRNGQSADLVLGQLDFTSLDSNNSSKLCDSNGTDTDGNPTFPPRCLATLEFPRFALSDGKRLFIADGGNDRVLIYNDLPVRNGQPATYVIGQLGGSINQASDSTDSMRTPLALAWDGSNLYITDAYNRRVLVYTLGLRDIPYSGVRNGASKEIFASGSVTVGGIPKENDELTVTIKYGDTSNDYKYKVLKDDTLEDIVKNLTDVINANTGDPFVFATPNAAIEAVLLTSRLPGTDGNDITLTVSASTDATTTISASSSTLSGGGDAGKVAPGTEVTVLGDNLSETTAAADPNAKELPNTMAGVQVYFDGIRAPLYFVSPTEIRAQMPFEVVDRTSVNAYVRTQYRDGRVKVTSPIAVTIVPQNPGIFAEGTQEPRAAVMYHGSANATGTVSVDGSAKKDDVATVTIEDRSYSYKVVDGDTLTTIRDALVQLINDSPDEKVTAIPSTSFTRLQLRAKVAGPDGNGIRFGAVASDGAEVVMTAFNSALCCANVGRVTEDNPAVPGETVIVYATGLGMSKEPVEQTGIAYDGPLTEPKEFVSSLAGAKTANVLGASLATGLVGVYQVTLELNSDLPTNPQTQLTIAQDVYVSNIVTFPLFNENPAVTTP